jgi:hypothetical protein
MPRWATVPAGSRPDWCRRIDPKVRGDTSIPANDRVNMTSDALVTPHAYVDGTLPDEPFADVFSVERLAPMQQSVILP